VASNEQTDRPGLDELITEGRLSDVAPYDELSTRELVELINREDAV